MFKLINLAISAAVDSVQITKPSFAKSTWINGIKELFYILFLASLVAITSTFFGMGIASIMLY